MDRFILIFAGPQGSGKGTQAKYFSEYLHAPRIGTGEIFRRHAQNTGIVARALTKYIRNGRLVPNSIIRILLIKKLRQYQNEPIIIFDGVPRTLSQKRMLDSLLHREKKCHVKMILIDIPIKDSQQRLRNRKRDDDLEDTIKKRLHIYYSKTVPMINEYKHQKNILIIDGTASIDKVTECIKNKLKADKDLNILFK